jgi:hypothetical protein
MADNPYLQHLIADPNFGYLFPHRLALAAFGVPNDYHLRKHYPRLVDGQHYIKIRGSDHVERLFYTLVGLLALSDLVNTPQAQAFKQALIAHTQPGGAMVQAQPASLYQSPSQAASSLYGEPTPTATPSELAPIGYPVTSSSPFGGNSTQADPAYLVAQYLQPQIERAIERSLAARVPASSGTAAPVPSQMPQDPAALIFEAQRVASEQAQQTAQTLLNAQRLIAEQQPSEIYVSVNLWKRWDNWLSQQDTWAMSLIAAAVVALAGISAYFFVGAAVRQAPAPNYSTQSWR